MTLAVILLIPLMGFASALLPRSADCSPGATVQTSQGPIIGHSAANRTQVNEFLGIPYAQPPLGSLRFAAPQKYAKNETFNAIEFVSPVNLPAIVEISADSVELLVPVRISLALAGVANLNIVNVLSPHRSPSHTLIRLHKSLAS